MERFNESLHGKITKIGIQKWSRKAFMGLALVVIIPVSYAFAFDNAHSVTNSQQVAVAPLVSEKLSSSNVADMCLPLLKSIRHNAQEKVIVRNQRSAEKAAAVGLVFGVRFALGPTEVTKTNSREAMSFDPLYAQSDSPVVKNDRSALAIVAYRKCQKQQALKIADGSYMQR